MPISCPKAPEGSSLAADRGQRALKPGASANARALLLSCLDTRQRKTFEKNGSFVVRSRDHRRRYRIDTGRAGNVSLLGPDRRPVVSFCIHLPIEYPDESTMLAQKLMLDAEEESFLLLANCKLLDDAAYELLKPVLSLSFEFLLSREARTIRRVFHDGLERVINGSPCEDVARDMIWRWGDLLIRRLIRDGLQISSALHTLLSIRLRELIREFGLADGRMMTGDARFGPLLTRWAQSWLDWIEPQTMGESERALTASATTNRVRETRFGPYQPRLLLETYRKRVTCTDKSVYDAARVDFADFKRWLNGHRKMPAASEGARRLVKILRSNECPEYWNEHFRRAR